MRDQEPDAAPPAKAALGADLIISLLAAAFTIYFLITSADLVWEARANGTVIGVALLVLIAIQVARVLEQVREGRATLGLGDFGRLTGVQVTRLTVLAILVGFVAVVPWLGTTLGLLVAMLLPMWTLGVRDLPTLLGVAFATAGTVYLLFIALLKTQLPAGPIEQMLQPLFGAG